VKRISDWFQGDWQPLPECHNGTGTLQNLAVFGPEDFDGPIRFLNSTILPPGTSIGEHRHGDDEELYIILEGQGTMTLDGVSRPVKKGSVLVNCPGGTHGLRNDSEKDLWVLVLEAAVGPK